MSGEQDDKPDESAEPTKPKQQSERRESGLTAIQEARIHKRAAEDNWAGAQRWPTSTPVTELQETGEKRPLTPKDLAMMSVVTDLTDKDRRVRRIARNALLAMERQNQEDEHKQRDGKSSGNRAPKLRLVVLKSREEVEAHEADKQRQLDQPEPQTGEEEDAD